MHWALVRVETETWEPVALGEAKGHLRVDIADDDALIGRLTTAAREQVEEITGRAIVAGTWDLVLDSWPCGAEISLPRPPLRSVSSVTYKLADGSEATLDPALYAVDAASEPGRIVLAPGASWPPDELYPVGAVRIRYAAGYTSAAAVPVGIWQAMLLLIGHLYENREAVAVGHTVTQLPLAVDALLAPWRVWWCGP